MAGTWNTEMLNYLSKGSAFFEGKSASDFAQDGLKNKRNITPAEIEAAIYTAIASRIPGADMSGTIPPTKTTQLGEQKAAQQYHEQNVVVNKPISQLNNFTGLNLSADEVKDKNGKVTIPYRYAEVLEGQKDEKIFAPLLNANATHIDNSKSGQLSSQSNISSDKAQEKLLNKQDPNLNGPK